MIPVFVISLTRSQERRAAVVRQMQRLSIEFTFWDAVDGKNLTQEELKSVDFPLAEQTSGHVLSHGEVGCALSHIRLYEHMVENGIARAIVLEDDIYLHTHIKRLVEKACSLSRADIIFLHHGKAKSWPFKVHLVEGYRLARYISPSKRSLRGVLSTAGYILTQEGARKLLNKAYPVRMPSDYLTGRLQMTGLSAAGVEPCCLDVDLFATTIEDRTYGHYLEQNESDKG